MTPNREYIIHLVGERDWSWSELARRMGISRTEVCRFASGKRTGGKKFMSGILKAFPAEPIDKLFFLP